MVYSLAENGEVKIGDFGLAKDVLDSGVYTQIGQCNLPCAWMAIEVFETMQFTIESDVVSLYRVCRIRHIQ